MGAPTSGSNKSEEEIEESEVTSGRDRLEYLFFTTLSMSASKKGTWVLASC